MWKRFDPSRPFPVILGAVVAGILAGLVASVLPGAFTVMPCLRYPPNPPGVGDPATLSERQWKSLALIFLSLVILAGAARLSGHLRARGWTDDERLAAVGLAVVVPLGLLCA